MSTISFIDDNMVLAKYYLQRDYSELAEEIKLKKEKFTGYIELYEMLAGFTVSKNESLSKMSNSNFFVVRFTLANFRRVM